MIDLHTHILPNIDDGAESIEESVKMLNISKNNGISTAVLTPHFDAKNNDIDDFIEQRYLSFTRLKLRLEETSMDMNLVLASEVMVSSSLLDIDLSKLAIEGTDYILIELPTRRNEIYVFEVINKIIASGFIPIIAHIERYDYLIKDTKKLVEIIKSGALTQVNMSSILNKNDYPFIDVMIKKNLIHLIGSDCHNTTLRSPKKFDMQYYKIFKENQEKVLRNELISLDTPKRLNIFLGTYF